MSVAIAVCPMRSAWLGRVYQGLDTHGPSPVHAEGGFGVTFNEVTKDVVFYTTTSRFVVWLGAFSQERQGLWLPKDDLRDSSSW